MLTLRLFLLTLFTAACEQTIPTQPGTPQQNENNSSATVTVTVNFPPTPAPPPPPPTPPPGTPPNGGRTPDPPAGTVLPLPTYGQTVVNEVAASNPQLVAQSCIPTFGLPGWGFLDAVVDRLRRQDTRWGYVCSRGDCNNPSQDSISYHATAGPETTGTTGIYIIDIIESYCLTPRAGFLNMGFDPLGLWTSRGRF